MRSLTLFKSLVSGYRKRAFSTGDMRNSGAINNRDMHGDDDMLVDFTFQLLMTGAILLASTRSQPQEDPNKSSSDLNTNVLKQEQKQVAQMLVLKALQEEHPEYSIMLEEQTPDDKQETSGPKLP